MVDEEMLASPMGERDGRGRCGGRSGEQCSLLAYTSGPVVCPGISSASPFIANRADGLCAPRLTLCQCHAPADASCMRICPRLCLAA
jgi:hypothetical protein